MKNHEKGSNNGGKKEEGRNLQVGGCMAQGGPPTWPSLPPSAPAARRTWGRRIWSASPTKASVFSSLDVCKNSLRLGDDEEHARRVTTHREGTGITGGVILLVDLWSCWSAWRIVNIYRPIRWTGNGIGRLEKEIEENWRSWRSMGLKIDICGGKQFMGFVWGKEGFVGLLDLLNEHVYRGVISSFSWLFFIHISGFIFLILINGLFLTP